jgi:hypothetical protein
VFALRAGRIDLAGNNLSMLMQREEENDAQLSASGGSGDPTNGAYL